MSIRIREIGHPAFRNRILSFSQQPSWIDVSEFGDDFVGKVQKIRRDPNWAMNTNFEALCDKILDGLVSAEVNPSETRNIILAVYSDMQIDAARGWGEGDQKRTGGKPGRRSATRAGDHPIRQGDRQPVRDL